MQGPGKPRQAQVDQGQARLHLVPRRQYAPRRLLPNIVEPESRT